MNECIHFDGKECRNMESTYYSSYGDFCADCENKKGDDTMNEISNAEKEAIKTQMEFIKNVIEEINNIDKKTNDQIWDLGPIETTFKVYEVLEKECQRIIYKLNIDFNMSEWHITKSVPKAIKLIEKEIL